MITNSPQASFFISSYIPDLVQQEQLATAVIDAYFTAAGGIDKFRQLKTLSACGTISIDGISLNYNRKTIHQEATQICMNVRGKSVSEMIWPGQGWRINELRGYQHAEPISPDELQYRLKDLERLDIQGPLVDYPLKGYTVFLNGEVKEGRSRLYRIVVKKNNAVSAAYYFNTRSYMLVKTEKKYFLDGQELQEVICYSDYRETDFGIKLPHKVKTNAVEEILQTIEKCEINQPFTINPVDINLLRASGKIQTKINYA